MGLHVITYVMVQISGSEQNSAASQDLRKLAPKALLTVNFHVRFSQFLHAYTTNNKQYDHRVVCWMWLLLQAKSPQATLE
jgi:predicted subunit of tRNA(5-methylaminomethyl-2-thiouridylate) methyltransferase